MNGTRRSGEAELTDIRGVLAFINGHSEIYSNRASITAITCAPFQNAARWKV
jgi:hypothetical protein